MSKSDDSSDTDAESDEFIYVVKQPFVRSKSVSESGNVESFYRGDEIEPTPEELMDYRERFVKLTSDGRLASDVEVARELTPEEKLSQEYRRGR